MKTIDHWIKINNRRLIEIEVRNDDSWYMAYAGDKLLTKADASLESLRDTLYGNGCIRLIGENSWEKKNVELSASWRLIDWFQLPCVRENVMNRALLEDIINDCKKWKPGDCVLFTYATKNIGRWLLTLKKEEEIYDPLKFSLTGEKEGTHETIGRRYVNAEEALLHMFNDFNENACVRNRYNNLEEVMQNLYREGRSACYEIYNR